MAGFKKKETDKISGVETTGHEWDGLKELNNPAPRWWLWVFVITMIWAAGYWLVYPAWPTISGHTKGFLGWTQHKQLVRKQEEISARKNMYLEKFRHATFEQIRNDPELYAFALAGGAAAFKDNCATCHGTGATGGKGYPNLNDDDWLWGGKLEAIYHTIRYGVRSGHAQARESQMPAFGRDKLLTSGQIAAVADYVIALSEGKADLFGSGAAIFRDQCSSCHGFLGEGDHMLGAPSLKDKIWLYGADQRTVIETISNTRRGVMPHWINRLDDDTIRQLAIYVHSLGGGE